jgi:hypothetical protein
MNATAPRSTTPEQYVFGRHAGRFEVVDAVGPQSRSRHAVLHFIADLACRIGSTITGACRLSGNPAYFEYDRRPRSAVDLGGGLTWESDSFWPASYPRG